MMHRTEHSANTLEDRILEARSRVQRTPEWHPQFEQRLFNLIHLVDERDARQVAPRAFATGGGRRCVSRRA
jgi:hypothetical protein